MSDERKRGLRRAALAVLLLLVAFVLLIVWVPARGHYPDWQRWIVVGLGASGWLLFWLGIYGLVVGPGGGILKFLAVGVVVAGLCLGAVAGWVVQVALWSEYSEHKGGGWDWD